MNKSNIRYSFALKWAIFKNTIKELAAQFVESFMFRQGLILFASKLNYSAALEKARMDAITTIIGNAGLLYIYSGTQPSGPAGADGTLVAGPFTMGSPFASGATTALPSVLSPTLPSNVNASTSLLIANSNIFWMGVSWVHDNPSTICLTSQAPWHTNNAI